MEATDQGAATDSHVREYPIVESGDQFHSYVTPLVQHPPMDDTSFQSSMEGCADSPIEIEYGPNTPF